MTGPTTVQQVLDLPLGDNDSGAATVRGYLIKLLSTLWRDEGDFKGSAPFGNSAWQHDLYKPMVEAGLITGSYDGGGYVIDVDEAAADTLIQAAIASLASAPPAGPPAVTVIVTGGNDDLIDVEGAISEEFPFYRNDQGGVIAFSDGTVLLVRRPDGVDGDYCWRISAIALGTAALTIDPATGDESTDTATLTGDIRWVVRGNTFVRATRR